MRYLKQIKLALKDPALTIHALALWTMPIATAVVVFGYVSTTIAGLPMPAHPCGLTVGEQGQDALLIGVDR